MNSVDTGHEKHVGEKGRDGERERGKKRREGEEEEILEESIHVRERKEGEIGR